MRADDRRIWFATFFGALTGGICYAGRYFFYDFDNTILHFIWVLLNRTMVGFVIGISRLRMHWALHGMLIGSTVGALFPWFVLLSTGDVALTVLVYLLSVLFGFLIELFTSRVSHAPQTE